MHEEGEKKERMRKKKDTKKRGKEWKREKTRGIGK